MNKNGNGIFHNPDNDPLGNILAAGGNVVANHALRRLSIEAAKRLGLSGDSPEKELALTRARLQLQRMENDATRAKAMSEKQLRLIEIRIQEKEIELTERKRRLETAEAQKAQLALPKVTEVVSGALEVTANAEGLASPDPSEGYQLWLDSFEGGKVILILGRRGSGKTALAGKIAEYMMAVHRMPVYWIGLPAEARVLLPSWIKMADSPEQCPMGSFMIIDEAGIQYLSLAFNTDRNKLLRALLMICRHRHSSLVFAVQSSRDAEASIVRQCDTVIFKEPGMNQPDTERPDVRARAKKAALAFRGMPKDEKREAACVFDDNFEGIIKSNLPSFWSEDLSHVYAHLDLATMQQQVARGQELQKTVAAETKLLDAASTDKEILELKRQGYGIEKIAKILNCKVWTVRKALEGME